MTPQNKSPFPVGAVKEAGSFLKQHKHHTRNFRRRTLDFYATLKKYPVQNPVLLAIDEDSFKAIHQRRGVCLLCLNTFETYEWDFCYAREVWILYANKTHFEEALYFGRGLQNSGARKIVLLLVSPAWMGGAQ